MHRNAIFRAEGADLADHPDTVRDEPITHPMQGLQVDLVRAPNLDEAHGRSRRGPATASASMMSFLFDFTYGFTNFAGMIRSVWSIAISLRASHGSLGHVSMLTTVGAARSKNCSNVSLRKIAY